MTTDEIKLRVALLNVRAELARLARRLDEIQDGSKTQFRATLGEVANRVESARLKLN